MSSITVNTPDGKSLNVAIPDGFTPDQIHQSALEALNHYQGQAQPQSPLLDKLASSQPVPSAVQNAAETLNVPARAGRAVGVGLGNAAESTGFDPMNIFPSSPVGASQIKKIADNARNPSLALQGLKNAAVRGYQAFQTGFKPTPNEQNYAQAGEAAGNAATVAAGGMAAGALTGGAGLAADTALMGGTTALNQAQSGKMKVLPSAKDELTSISDYLSDPTSFTKALGVLPDSVAGNAAVPGAIKAVQSGISAVSKAILPGLLKGTQGTPQQATELALNDPKVLKEYQGTQQAVQEKVGNVIDAVQQAKLDTGNSIRKIFKKYAGMDSPVEEILAPQVNDIPPTRDWETIKKDWRSAQDGTLFQTPNKAGGVDLMSNQDKLATLTRLKREANQYADYFKQVGINGSGTVPIDSAMSASAKQIASDVGTIRNALPNGQKLGQADQAWTEIHNIYNAIQKDLSDPGKAQDMIMKLVKGDVTWLTGGRMAQKISAIRRVEQMTGQSVLGPAMKELTAAIFNEKWGKGLSPYIAATELGSGVTLAATGHPMAAISMIPALATGSPKVVGGAIKAAQTIGELGRPAAIVGPQLSSTAQKIFKRGGK